MSDDCRCNVIVSLLEREGEGERERERVCVCVCTNCTELNVVGLKVRCYRRPGDKVLFLVPLRPSEGVSRNKLASQYVYVCARVCVCMCALVMIDYGDFGDFGDCVIDFGPGQRRRPCPTPPSSQACTGTWEEGLYQIKAASSIYNARCVLPHVRDSRARLCIATDPRTVAAWRRTTRRCTCSDGTVCDFK